MMKLLVIVLIFFTSSLYADGVVNWKSQLHDYAPKKRFFRSNPTERLNGLNYLNSMRTGAGLIPFTANDYLDTAAQNHTDYLVYHNLFGHYEDETNYPELFTGVNAGNRITAAGYGWYSYGENLSSGDSNVYESIDGLMTAIYHRFGFLTLLNDELGIGSSEYSNGSLVFNYNMANTDWWNTRPLNPIYILWPHSNYDNAQTSFNNYESPDPTPECPSGGITGNPISIEFNPDKTDTISMTSFRLYDADNVEINDTKILTQSSDPNGHLDANQFVLFPMTSLSLDSRYHAVFEYTEAGTPKTLSWYFNTRRYEEKRYEVETGESYDVISGQSYIIHIKPANCTTTLNYIFNASNGNAIVERLDYDLMRISVTSDTTFSIPNFSFTLHVAPTDNAIEPSTQNSPALVPVIHYLLN